MAQGGSLTKAEERHFIEKYGEAPEDRMPFLLFKNEGVLDRHQTNLTGQNQYRNAVIVEIMAHGDTKTIVPQVVVGWTVETRLVKTEKDIPITISVQREDEHGKIYFEDESRVERRVVEEPQFIYTETFPWFEKLRERLKNGQISKNYYDSCVRAYDQWKETNEIPVDGVPLIEWRMIDEALKKKFIEMGINTVERLAEATEEALEQAGMGSRDAKKKAETYLRTNNDASQAAAMVTQMENELETKTAEFEATMSDYEKKLAELEAQVQAQAQTIQTQKEAADAKSTDKKSTAKKSQTKKKTDKSENAEVT